MTTPATTGDTVSTPWERRLLLLSLPGLAFLMARGLGLQQDSMGYVIEGPLTGDTLLIWLAGERTLGFPLFLKALSAASPSFALFPAATWLVNTLCVWFLFRQVLKTGLRPLTAWLVCAPLLFHQPLLYFGRVLGSDCVGASLSLAAVGGLLWVLTRPRQAAAWATLALFTFLAYQVRPAYLGLVVSLPVLGVVLALVGARHSLSVTRRPLLLGLGLGTATIAPLLLFCALRLSLVGSFALTSFGHINLFGLTSQLLTNEELATLPGDLPLVGEKIAEARHGPYEQCLLPDYGFSQIETMCYNEVLWPVVGALQKDGMTMAQIDEALGRFNATVLRRAPVRYVKTVMKLWLFTLVSLVNEHAVLLFSGLLLVLSWLRQVFRPVPLEAAALRRELGERAFVGWLAGVHFFLLQWVVVLVELPVKRYTHATGIFIACVLLLAAVLPWRRNKDDSVGRASRP